MGHDGNLHSVLGNRRPPEFLAAWEITGFKANCREPSNRIRWSRVTADPGWPTVGASVARWPRQWPPESGERESEFDTSKHRALLQPVIPRDIAPVTAKCHG